MNQFLRCMIVLMLSCVCFAQQQRADKIQAPSSAQNLEKESQKADTGKDVNQPSAPPAYFGAIQKINLSLEANSWAIQIISRGGIAGTGSGDMTITSQGDIVWKGIEDQCSAKLEEDVLQALAQTILSARISEWNGTISGSCADCFEYMIALQRREADGKEREYYAYWDQSTASHIPESLKKIYDKFSANTGCKK